MRTPRLLSLIGLLLCLASGSAAGKKKLAVLEFGNGTALKAREAAYMVDLVRAEAVKLPEAQFLIMTRENIQALLPPEVDLATCEGDCEVETGRNLGADYVITGEFVEIGGEIKVSMRLYDTASGGLKASEHGSARRLKLLEPVIRITARRLIQSLHPAGQASPQGFGLNLPTHQNNQATRPAIPPPDRGQALLSAQVLLKFEAAIDLEQAAHQSPLKKIKAWQTVANHPQVDPSLKAQAIERAHAWHRAAGRQRAQCKQTREVAARREQDQAQLDDLLKLKDTTLPPDRKAALKAEFAATYQPWAAALKTLERDCGDLHSGFDLMSWPSVAWTHEARTHQHGRLDLAMFKATAREGSRRRLQFIAREQERLSQPMAPELRTIVLQEIARQQFLEAWYDLLMDRPAEPILNQAVQNYQKAIEAAPTSIRRADAFYQLAVSQAVLGRPEAARAACHKVIYTWSRSRHVAHCALLLAEIARLDGHLHKAKGFYLLYFKGKNSEWAAYANFRLAQTHQQLFEPAEAEARLYKALRRINRPKTLNQMGEYKLEQEIRRALGRAP